MHWGHVPYADLLHKDPELRTILLSLDLPRFVFTNAVGGSLKIIGVAGTSHISVYPLTALVSRFAFQDKEHARICLDILGIADCFDGVFHFESLNEV